MTYTDRHLTEQTVKKLTRHDSGTVELLTTGGQGMIAPPEVAELLTPGAQFGLEVRGLSLITGWMVGGRWVARKTDDDLAREHREMVERIDRKNQEKLARYRAEWIGREENLPPWLQARMRTFHQRGGARFETGGWGYELVVCELAALYAESGGAETEAINAYSHQEGTSGNQHNVAAVLAKAHLAGETLEGTVSALTPITGDPFYEGPGG